MTSVRRRDQVPPAARHQPTETLKRPLLLPGKVFKSPDLYVSPPGGR